MAPWWLCHREPQPPALQAMSNHSENLCVPSPIAGPKRNIASLPKHLQHICVLQITPICLVFPRPLWLGWGWNAQTLGSRLWDLQHKSRCAGQGGTRTPRPHWGWMLEGRGQEGLRIASAVPEIAAQKLQTQKARKKPSLPSLAPVPRHWQARIYLPGSDEQTGAEHSSHRLGLLGRGQVSHFVLQVCLLTARPVPKRP